MKKINNGKEYCVFRKNDNSAHVFKVPVNQIKEKVDRVLQHEEILREELGSFYVSSKLRKTKKFNYVLKQRFIQWKTLNLANIESVIQQYEQLVKIRINLSAKHPLRMDFLWRVAFINLVKYFLFLQKSKDTELSDNLIIEESSGKLFLVDNGMFSLVQMKTKIKDFMSISVSQILIKCYRLKNKLQK